MSPTSMMKGDVEIDPCKHAAACHAIDVYGDSLGSNPGDSSVQDHVDLVKQGWEEWGQKSNPSNGFFSRLYKVKNWDPSDKETIVCPPVLAFRGTNFEDMRGMALAVEVSLYYGAKTWDFVLPLGSDVSGVTTKEALIGKGFDAFELLDESGWVYPEGATDGTALPVRAYVKAELFASSKGGDWASNVRQGLGQPAKQYEDGIKWARTCATQYFSKLAQKSVRVTGHSLGGGLGGAASAVLDARYPDLLVHGLTFNAAGVHENTIAPQGASLSDGNVDCVNVDDEVLTSLQSYASKMPLVGSIFRLAERTLGQNGMRPAIGNLEAPLAPHSPSGEALPFLFPLDAQTVTPGGADAFPTITMVDKELQSATDAMDFVEKLLTQFNALYRDRAKESVDKGWFGVYTIKALYEEMVELFLKDFDPEMAALTKLGHNAVTYHGMPVVIASYDVAIRERSALLEPNPVPPTTRPRVENPTDAQVKTSKELGIDPCWVKKNGELDWPTDDGFDGKPQEKMLRPGTVVDRYGDEKGSFVSPEDVPFEKRSIPSGFKSKPLKRYIVKKPFIVQSGPATSHFGQPGGATQYKLVDPADTSKKFTLAELIEDKYLEEIE